MKGIGQASYSGFAKVGGAESSRGKRQARNRSSHGRGSEIGSALGSRIGSNKRGSVQTSKILDPVQREA